MYLIRPAAPMPWECALRRSVPGGGRDSVVRSKVKVGRRAIARYARLGLDERARRYRSPAAGWIGEADFAILSWLG
jgi:hypothetical protein